MEVDWEILEKAHIHKVKTFKAEDGQEAHLLEGGSLEHRKVIAIEEGKDLEFYFKIGASTRVIARGQFPIPDSMG